MRSTRRLIVLPACAWWLLATGGCADRTLVAGLSNEEAQRCAIVLRANGLEVSVESAQGGDGEGHGLDLRGDDADYRSALQILEEHGLPRRASPGFSASSNGLIPSPSEERARYIKGLSGEIEGLLESIDGIAGAEVLVSLPERRPLAGVPADATTASVVISHMGAASPVTPDEVSAVIVRAVGAALEPDRVAVVLKPVVRGDAARPIVRYERDRAVEAGFAAAVGLLAVLHGLTVWRLRALRLRLATHEDASHAD